MTGTAITFMIIAMLLSGGVSGYSMYVQIKHSKQAKEPLAATPGKDT